MAVEEVVIAPRRQNPSIRNARACEELDNIERTLNGPRGINYQINLITAAIELTNLVTFSSTGADIIANNRTASAASEAIQQGRSVDALSHLEGLRRSLYRGGGATAGAFLTSQFFGAALREFQAARRDLLAAQVDKLVQMASLGC
jgi:hypothetical protein